MDLNQTGEPATIEEAYDELTPTAFAVWIRLMMAKPRDLVGRKKVARAISFSPARTNQLLRELKLKGYIKISSYKRGKPARIILYRRPKLAGPSGFITLSNYTLPPPSILADEEQRRNIILGKSKRPWKKNKKVSAKRKQNKGRKKTSRKSKDSPPLSPGLPASLNPHAKTTLLENFSKSSGSLKNPGNTRRKDGGKASNQSKNIGLGGRETTHGIAGSTVPNTRRKMRNFEVSASSEPLGSDTNSSSKNHGGTISLEKLKAIRDKNKKEKSEKAKRRKKPKALRDQSIAWEKLDQRGNPAISFSPSNKRRKQMIEVLDQPDSNRTKQAVLKKMGSEFGRIYSRYRRLLQKERGQQPTYLLPQQEHKYAAKAAEWCIRKSVTPRQVLAYWHYNIGNFAEAKMDIPPLVFLSGPANIDTVACANLDELEGDTPKKPKPVGHGFSDASELDHRLRPALEDAGFETMLFNDRYLLNIQKTAMAIAKGVRLFVGTEMKAMVDWAAENLYGSKD